MTNVGFAVWCYFAAVAVPTALGFAELWGYVHRASLHRGWWYSELRMEPRSFGVGFGWRYDHGNIHFYAALVPCVVVHVARYSLMVVPQGAVYREPGERAEPLPEAPDDTAEREGGGCGECRGPCDCTTGQQRFPFSDEPAPLAPGLDDDTDSDPMGD